MAKNTNASNRSDPYQIQRLTQDWRPRDLLAENAESRQGLRFSSFFKSTDRDEKLFPSIACPTHLAEQARWGIDNMVPFFAHDPAMTCWPEWATSGSGSLDQRMAFRTLASELMDNLSLQSRKSSCVCCSLRQLAEICFNSRFCMDDPPLKLSGLYPLLSRVNQGEQEALFRWQVLYEHRLRPLLRRQIKKADSRRVDEALKKLIVLQALGAPNRFDDSPSDLVTELLLHLTEVCHGQGLVAWRSDEGIHFAIESDDHHLSNWLLLHVASTLEGCDWNRIVSDAVWSALFPGFSTRQGAEQKSIGNGLDEGVRLVSEATLPGRQGVVLNQSDTEMVILVFESPLPWQRGHRMRWAASSVAGSARLVRWLVWEPVLLEDQQIRPVALITVLAKLLRSCRKKREFVLPVSQRLLERYYSEHSRSALCNLMGAYRRGKIVGRNETWKDFGEITSIAGIVRRVASDSEIEM